MTVLFSEMDVSVSGFAVDEAKRRIVDKKVVSYMSENEDSDECENEECKEWKDVQIASKNCIQLKTGI